MPTVNCKPLPPVSQADIEKFWTFVDKTAGQGPKGDCWTWTSHMSRGYGVFYVSMQKMVRSLRFAFLSHTGEDPYPHLVLHTCDNPACVNPAHLYLGDYAQNTKDAIDRNRFHRGPLRDSSKMRRGSMHPHSKLTENIVEQARILHAEGATATVLAAQFDVTISSMSKILKGEFWKHAPGPTTTEKKHSRGEGHHMSKVTPEIVQAIRADHSRGVTYAELARRYGLTSVPIRAICLRKTWKHVV